ncbi:hypothetical protein L1987_30626 [Smallanthus sonchifolius]|uniref:Uncharacterized protein n=1 Tax=Smallanthus sonchifolius TaxID=185202 RepID=A0ACB9I2Q4_9ASTR|nr:hypothetical protein L1987_30626 [Smallanthus sonchifolius]
MFPFPVSASAYISTSNEVPIEVHGCLRIHHDGRFERLAGLNTILAGTDQMTDVQCKDVVISHETNLSASPEYPIPTPYEDSWDAIKWVASHARENGPEPWLNAYADLHKVFLAGDSSGANIAHNMAIQVGLNLNPTRINLKGVILLHPYFQGKDPIGPELGKDGDFKALADLMWKLAGRGRIGLDDPLLNPAMDPRISNFGCSKILLCVAEKDKFTVRSLNYKKVMEKRGWKGRVELMESKGERHGFFLFDTSCTNACNLRRRICSFINPTRSNV